MTSADGTEIAYEIHGTGQPLVLFHGSTADRDHWGPLVRHLTDAFRLVAADRRGRGDSGDAAEYSLDREVADLRALVDAVDGDRRGALRLFLEEAGGVPDVEQLRWWPEEAPFDRVETVLRESRAVESFRLPDEPAVDVPTLLLTGEHGPRHLKESIETLHERLSDSRLVELAGVGHTATINAPETSLRQCGRSPATVAERSGDRARLSRQRSCSLSGRCS